MSIPLGIGLRNMGDLATGAILRATAQAADEAGLDSLWVTDHLAIPPDDAEGSNGRYLDPLATLAYLAAATERIKLATGVLILPYRPPLPTAKWVATVQDLSGGRLLLGVGVGWMQAEFRALGIERRHRGRDTDRTLEFLHRCFADDEVSENGQTFLFRPRPARPPFFIGGAGRHALERVVRYGDGWLPVRTPPEKLATEARILRDMSANAGREETPTIVAMSSLPLDDAGATADRIAQYAQAGVAAVVHAAPYASEKACLQSVERLSRHLD